MKEQEVAVVVSNARSYRNSRGCSAPCASTGANTNNSSLKKLQQIEFAIVETALYLDAYPENKTALAYYNKLLEEREKLTASLSQGGRPMTALDAGRNDRWDWIDSPWPWALEANL